MSVFNWTSPQHSATEWTGLASMPVRYWIGVVDDDPTKIANWATASGGPGGASVPTSANAVILDGNGNNPFTLPSNMTFGSFTIVAGYTAKCDMGDVGATLTVPGNNSLAGGGGGELDLGTTGTITTAGDFDFFSHAGTLTKGTSTVIMTGVGNLAGLDTASPLFTLTLASGCTVTVTESVGINGTLAINGDVSVAAGKQLWDNGAATTFGADGDLSGDGALTIRSPMSGQGITVLSATANITIAKVEISSPFAGAIIAAGTYSPTLFLVSETAVAASVLELDGAYTFNGDVEYSLTGGGSLHIKNDTNNPATIEYRSDVLVTGAVDYTAGSGDMLATLSADQVFNGNGKTFEPLTINKPSGELDLTSGIFTLGANSNAFDLTVSGDADLDLDTFDVTLVEGGTFTLNTTGTFVAGSGTMTIINGGHLITAVGTYTKGGQLVMNGTCTISVAANQRLNDVQINGATTTVSNTFFTDIDVNNGGTFVNNTGIMWVYGEMAVKAGGTFVVSFPCNFFRQSGIPGSLVENSGTITGSSLLTYYVFANSMFANGIYDVATEILHATGSPVTWTPESGTYTFTKALTLHTTSAGTLAIAANTNSPIWVFQGNVIWTEDTGTITWTKGGGVITLAGGNANINFNGSTIEDLVINATGTKTFDAGWISDSYLQTAGTVASNGQTLETTGDWSINGGSFSDPVGSTLIIGGDFISRGIDLVATGGANSWNLNVAGAGVILGGTVTNCDASGSASDILAFGAVNGGGNSPNILFLPIGGGKIGAAGAFDRAFDQAFDRAFDRATF